MTDNGLIHFLYLSLQVFSEFSSFAMYLLTAFHKDVVLKGGCFGYFRCTVCEFMSSVCSMPSGSWVFIGIFCSGVSG